VPVIYTVHTAVPFARHVQCVISLFHLICAGHVICELAMVSVWCLWETEETRERGRRESLRCAHWRSRLHYAWLAAWGLSAQYWLLGFPITAVDNIDNTNYWCCLLAQRVVQLASA